MNRQNDRDQRMIAASFFCARQQMRIAPRDAGLRMPNKGNGHIWIAPPGCPMISNSNYSRKALCMQAQSAAAIDRSESPNRPHEQKPCGVRCVCRRVGAGEQSKSEPEAFVLEASCISLKVVFFGPVL